MDCIFCKLAQGEIPTDVLYEDEEIFVFTDQNRRHRCIFGNTQKHIASLNEADADDAALLGRLLCAYGKSPKTKDLPQTDTAL